MSETKYCKECHGALAKRQDGTYVCLNPNCKLRGKVVDNGVTGR